MYKHFFSLFFVGLALASCSKQAQNTQVVAQGKPKCIPDPEDPTVCPKPDPTPGPTPTPKKDSFDLSLSTNNISFERGKINQITVDVTVDNIEFYADTKVVVNLNGAGLAYAKSLTFYSNGTQQMTIELLSKESTCPDKIVEKAFDIKASTKTTTKSNNIRANIKNDLNKFVCQFGSDRYDDVASMTTDSAGNVYVAGLTNGALPGQINYGTGDVFITKLDTTGNLKHYQFGSDGYDDVASMTTDSAGNVYIAGLTDGALPGHTKIGGSDVFITKLDTAGNLKHYQFGSGRYDSAKYIITDSVGNVYVAGLTNGALPGHINTGKNDVFITKLDTAGNLKHYQFGSDGYDGVKSMTIDSAGNVYVAGFINGTLPGQINYGKGDAFITKLDTTGNLKHYQFGSDEYDGVASMTTDSAGNVYVAGFTDGALPGHTNTGDSDVFITKLDIAGNLKHYQFDSGSYDSAQSIITDSVGNVYVAGLTSGALPGHTNTGGLDAFITKLDTVGNLKHYQFGSDEHDSVKSMTTDSVGNVYVAGLTDGALPGHTNTGNQDIFVTKLDTAGNLKHYQFGSDEYDGVKSMTTDSVGNVYAAGFIGGALPGHTNTGGLDVFIVKNMFK